jgi:hypothetical protein
MNLLRRHRLPKKPGGVLTTAAVVGLFAALACGCAGPWAPRAVEPVSSTPPPSSGVSEQASSTAALARSVAATEGAVPGRAPGLTTANRRVEGFGALMHIDDGKGLIWAITADPVSPTSSQLPKLIAIITNPADLQLDAFSGEYVRVRGLRMHGIDTRQGIPDVHVDEIVRATR